MGNGMGVTPHELFIDSIYHNRKLELSLFGGHLRMKYYLKQQVAQFTFQLNEVFALYRISNLISLFDCIGRYRLKILFNIPGTAALRITQIGHDL